MFSVMASTGELNGVPCESDTCKMCPVKFEKADISQSETLLLWSCLVVGGHIIVCIVGWVKSVVETLKKLPIFQCTD